MTNIVQFPLAAQPKNHIHCRECDGSEFRLLCEVGQPQSVICATCLKVESILEWKFDVSVKIKP